MDVKISTYDYLNKFVLGLVFIGAVVLSYGNEVGQFLESLSEGKWNNVVTTVFSVSALAIVYEAGILINRLGTMLEDFMRFLHLIPFDNDYKKFNEKKKEYPIMTVLSTEYALSRNSIVLFLLVSVVVLTRFGWYCLIPLSFALVFYYSCRKYAKKIVDLMR